MALRDLLVVLDGSPRRGNVLALAAALAQRHGAHLTGLCPLELLFPVSLGLTLSGELAPGTLQALTAQVEGAARETAKGIEAEFRAQLRSRGVLGDWEVTTGPAADAIAYRARTTDLLVLGQADPGHPQPAAAGGLIEHALLHAGRPLLLVPYAGSFESVGHTVLLGWNGSAAAARAAHDALMLIQPGAAVAVMMVEHDADDAPPQDVPCMGIAEHLARHGLKVSAARTLAGDDVAESDALLNYASDTGADLLVVGGYGHSPMHERLLGGVSRELLAHMTLPVLMSH